MSIRYIVFDIETVPDGDIIAATWYKGLSAQEAIEKLKAEQQEKHGNDFVPYAFHRPVSLGVVMVNDQYDIVNAVVVPTSLGRLSRTEVITRFFWQLYERHNTATLVTFNGRGFDLPVLELMAFKYGIPIKTYLTNKYGPRNRYSDGHLDLQEWVTNYGATRLAGGLDLLAKMAGCNGKGDVDGSQVETMYNEERFDDINKYCLEDALNTYFVFLRQRVLVGAIDQTEESCLRAAAAAHPVHGAYAYVGEATGGECAARRA